MKEIGYIFSVHFGLSLSYLWKVGCRPLGAVVEGFEDVEDDADAPSDASSWVRERSGSPCDAPSRLRRCSGSECRLLCLALPGLGLDAFVLRRREEDLLPIALRQLVYVKSAN